KNVCVKMIFEQGIAGVDGSYLSKIFSGKTLYIKRRSCFSDVVRDGGFGPQYGFTTPMRQPETQKEATAYFQPFYDLVSQQSAAQDMQSQIMENFGRFQKDQMDMVAGMVAGFNDTLRSMNETMSKMVENFQSLPPQPQYNFSKEAESKAVNAPHRKPVSEAVVTSNTIRVHQDPNSGKLVRFKKDEAA
ncbi:MAG: hypothetical protein AAF244_01870, partial [Pseudomonadota bacterium]